MANESQRKFNLFKPIPPPKTAWDKIYDWIVGKARIIIMITEILIAISFIGKVIVDTQAKNLDKEVVSNQEKISVYRLPVDFESNLSLEDSFRRVHQKEDDYKKLWNNSSAYTAVINEVYSYLDNPSSDIVLQISSGELSVYGAESLDVLEVIEEKIDSSPTFSEASISLSVEEGEGGIEEGEYSLQAKINPELLEREQL